MPRARTTYTAEYKLSAVKMITDQKLSVAEVGRRLDVSETLLRAWREAALAGGDAAFPGQVGFAPQRAEKHVRDEESVSGVDGHVEPLPRAAGECLLPEVVAGRGHHEQDRERANAEPLEGKLPRRGEQRYERVQ